MREISPALNATVEEYLRQMPAQIRAIVESIRAQKKANTRPVPSSGLIDNSFIADSALRRELIDKVGALVDENVTGRSDMCAQFALLLALALTKIGFPGRAVAGQATYFTEGNKIFSWKHTWVRVGSEVIDGNVDILFENPRIPPSVRVLPYWGPESAIPNDRRLRQGLPSRVAKDSDVNDIWWPELEEWISQRKE